MNYLDATPVKTRPAPKTRHAQITSKYQQMVAAGKLAPTPKDPIDGWDLPSTRTVITPQPAVVTHGDILSVYGVSDAKAQAAADRAQAIKDAGITPRPHYSRPASRVSTEDVYDGDVVTHSEDLSGLADLVTFEKEVTEPSGDLYAHVKQGVTLGAQFPGLGSIGNLVSNLVGGNDEKAEDTKAEDTWTPIQVPNIIIPDEEGKSIALSALMVAGHLEGSIGKTVVGVASNLTDSRWGVQTIPGTALSIPGAMADLIGGGYLGSHGSIWDTDETRAAAQAREDAREDAHNKSLEAEIVNRANRLQREQEGAFDDEGILVTPGITREETLQAIVDTPWYAQPIMGGPIYNNPVKQHAQAELNWMADPLPVIDIWGNTVTPTKHPSETVFGGDIFTVENPVPEPALSSVGKVAAGPGLISKALGNIFGGADTTTTPSNIFGGSGESIVPAASSDATRAMTFDQLQRAAAEDEDFEPGGIFSDSPSTMNILDGVSIGNMLLGPDSPTPFTPASTTRTGWGDRGGEDTFF